MIQPHLVPLHDLSHAYNLFVPGLDDRLFLSILYSVRICVLTLCMWFTVFSFVHWRTRFQRGWRLEARRSVSSICSRFKPRTRSIPNLADSVFASLSASMTAHCTGKEASRAVSTSTEWLPYLTTVVPEPYSRATHSSPDLPLFSAPIAPSTRSPSNHSFR
jgi:hypothetical protein